MIFNLIWLIFDMKSYQGVEILFFKWFLKVGFMIKYLFSKKLVYPKIFKIWILYQSHAQLVLVNIGAEDLKVFLISFWCREGGER